jgi:hypothetical protein
MISEMPSFDKTSADSMKTVILTAYPEENIKQKWMSLLDSADYASHYSSPEFFVEPYFYDKNPFAVLIFDENDRIDGVLTGIHVDGELICGREGTPNLIIRRGCDFDKIGRFMADALISHGGENCKLISVCAWNQNAGFLQKRFLERAYQGGSGTIVLDLTQNQEQLFKKISETQRRAIRNAIRANVIVTEFDMNRDFDEYYTLYVDWCTYKKLPINSYELQRSVFSNTDNRLILVARYEGKLIGVSTFRYRYPGIIDYAANVSRREESKYRQNSLLMWKAIEWAKTKPEFYKFNMAGAHYFLLKFGGDLHTTYRYRLDRTKFRRHDVSDALAKAAFIMFKSLPSPIRGVIKAIKDRNKT